LLKLAAPIATLCLLGAIGLDSSSRQYVPEGAGAYHRQVAEALELVPYRIGDWVGVDNEIRQEALQILDANASLSRTYRHIETGDAAVLLVVHCADARSLLGHYPPVCYPPQGWTEVSRSLRPVACEDVSLVSTLYDFTHDTLGRSPGIEVAHFAVLPDGKTAPDMDLLDRAARDKRTKFFGGASLQFVVDASLPEARRQEAREVLLRAISQWVQTVQQGRQP